MKQYYFMPLLAFKFKTESEFYSRASRCDSRQVMSWANHQNIGPGKIISSSRVHLFINFFNSAYFIPE